MYCIEKTDWETIAQYNPLKNNMFFYCADMESENMEENETVNSAMGIDEERATEIIKNYANKIMKSLIFPGYNYSDILLEISNDESMTNPEKVFIAYHYARIIPKLSKALNEMKKEE